MSRSVPLTTGGWRPEGICSFFVCDIASFNHATRNDELRSHMRKELYRALETAFGSAGMPFDEICYHEDRGDGVMVVVPPTYDPTLLLTSVAERLRAELRRYNERSSSAARMQVRAVVEVGMATFDGKGLVSAALTHAFRLLDAEALKDALKESGTSLLFAVSQRVYDDVVQHGRGTVNPGDYRPVEVRQKETHATAWIRVADNAGAAVQSLPGSRDIRKAGERWVHLGGDERTKISFVLVDSLLDIPMMMTERGRDQVVDALSPQIAQVIRRSPVARIDTVEILQTCLAYPGGLQQLLQAIRGYVGDSLAFGRLQQAVARLLTGSDRL
jgi:hypothetical protein